MKRSSSTMARGGFTLIEILIATLIFATIMLALNAVYYGAARLSTRATEIAIDQTAIAYAVNLMKNDFRAALPPGGVFSTNFRTDIQNMAHNGSVRLEFSTASGQPRLNEPWGDAQRVAYYLADPIDLSDAPVRGKELVRAVHRNLLPSVDEPPVEQWLMSGIETLQFHFYDGSQWNDTWDSESAEIPLPKAVKVRLLFSVREENGSAPPPLEFTAAVLAQAISTNSASTNSAGSASSRTGNNNSGPGNNNQPGSGGGNAPGTGGGNQGGGNSGGGRTGGGRTGGGR